MLTIILLATMVSCDTPSNSGNVSNTTSSKPAPITLTKENIKDYLVIEDSEDNERVQYHNGYVFAYLTDITVSIYPTVPGTFSNVEIKIKVECPDYLTSARCYISPSEKTIKLSSTGNKTEVFEAKNYDLSLFVYDIEIVSVSGTFYPQA